MCVSIESIGVIIVVDVSNALSLKDSDVWLEFLSQNAPKAAFRFLVVHKADLPLSERVITARNLDLFGWGLKYTNMYRLLVYVWMYVYVCMYVCTST